MTTKEKAKEHDIRSFALSHGANAKKKNGNVLCLCPFHNDKNTGSFVVYKDSFYCFSCEAKGDIIALCMQLFNLDFLGAIEHITGEKTETKSKPTQIMETPKEKPIKTMPEGVSKDLEGVPFISEYIKLLPEAYQQIALDVATKTGIRSYEGKLAFLYSTTKFFCNVKVQGFKGFNRTNEMSFLCKGNGKGLYNGILIKHMKNIVLVEAEKTAYLLNMRAKVYKLKFVAVATGGKSISSQQMKHLKGKNVFMLPDADAAEAWIEAGKKMIHESIGVNAVYVLPYPYEGKNDFADMILDVDPKDKDYLAAIDTLNFFTLNLKYRRLGNEEPKQETKVPVPVPAVTPVATEVKKPIDIEEEKLHIVKEFMKSLGSKLGLSNVESFEVLKMRNPLVAVFGEKLDLEAVNPNRIENPQPKPPLKK